MNCNRCGAPVPQGAAVCPVCGDPAAEWQQAQQPAQPVYQQSYVQYQTGQYPTGYQSAYTYGQQSDAPGFMTCLSDLPRAFVDSFTRPGEVLRSMVEKQDRFSFAIVAVLVLGLSFLGGVVLMRSFISLVFDAISSLTGVSMATNSAAMNQGISYIAGRVGPMTGGIAALCQLLCMAITAAVFMVYICAVCKVTFSWSLLLGFAAVVSLPTVPAALLAMAGSLLTPWAAVAVIMVGVGLSLTQACGMLSLITGRPDSQLLPAKMLCVGLSIGLVLTVCGIVGGLLMGGVMQRMAVLLANVGSLI